MGRITASATHELRNVLAIVKESAGLVGDLVRAAETRGPPDPARLLKATGCIEAQVARGADWITHLNRFAHSLDRDLESLDLDEEVRQVAFLSQRLARQKAQSVEAGPTGEPVPFQGNSLRVQMGIYSMVERCLEHLPEGAVLGLQAGRGAGGAVVTLSGSVGGSSVHPLPGHAPGWDGLHEQLGELGFSGEVSPGGHEVLLVFGGGE